MPSFRVAQFAVVFVVLAYSDLANAAGKLSNADHPTADTKTIFTRFTQLDAQVSQLRSRVEELESGALLAERVAQTTAKGVARSERRAVEAAEEAQRNVQSAGRLGASFVGTGVKVRTAAAQVSSLQAQLRGLESDVVRLGMYSSGLGTKIATLELNARELVPGVGGLDARLARTEASVTKLQQQVESNEIHGMIVANLRASLGRERSRVGVMAAESVVDRRADIEDEEGDDDVQAENKDWTDGESDAADDAGGIDA